MFKITYQLIAFFMLFPFFKDVYSQTCIDLPDINGVPASFVSPNQWQIWNSSPDIIIGNGVYPGTAQANITNVNGSSLAGGEIGFFLINGSLGANTEGIKTLITGLTIGNNYFFDVEWQQVILDYNLFSNDPSGGRLGVYIDGANVGVFNSLGGYDDHWQTATVYFTATSNQHEIGLKGELLDNSFMGAIVIDNFPCIAYLGGVLEEFKVDVNDDGIMLSWEVKSGAENLMFEVEKSVDLNNWQSAKIIEEPNDFIKPMLFSYLDRDPGFGVKYYRLKMIDLNGEVTYSKTQSATINSRDDVDVIVYPNPTVDYVSIEFKGKAYYKLIDLYGNDVSGNIQQLEVSPKKVKLDISKLIPGTYFIQTRVQTVRLIKF